MACDESTARQLLNEFFGRPLRDTVFVDVMKGNPLARTLVRSRGFAFSRPLTRMFRGPTTYPGRPGLLWAVLGPEFG